MTRRRLWRTNTLVWCAVFAGAVFLRVLNRVSLGEQPLAIGILGDAPLILLWAIATPFILRSAVWWPVRDADAPRNGVIHFALGTAYVVVSNAIIRLPLLTRGLRVFLNEELHGLAIYYPGAMAAYALVVALGHRRSAGEAPSAETPAPDRLVIREWNRVHLIALDDIDWIEADNNHVVVHTPQRAYKGRERMSDVEARLDTRRFVRVHRSAIVHIPRIREVQPLMRGDQAVVLRSGKIVRVSRSRRQALEEALGTRL